MRFIERLLGLMSPPPKQQTGLVREQSDIITDQEDQGTCFAHAVSHMLSRAVKIQLPFEFENQKEKCSHLYRTKSCINIFKCLLESREECKSQLDEYGWDKENISALLFTFIYRVLVNRFGCDGGEIDDSVNYFFSEYLKSTITLESVKDILNYNEDFFKHYLKVKVSLGNGESEKILDYFEHLIGKLFKILTQFKEIHKRLDYVLNLMYLPNEHAKSEEYSQTQTDDFIRKLKDALDRGFYAVLEYKHNESSEPHTITVTGFLKNEHGFVLTVKNSWGVSDYESKIVYFNNKAELTDFESYIYFVYPRTKLPGGGRRRINKTIRKKRRKKSKRRLSRK